MDHSAMALTWSICTERMLVDLLQTRRLRDIYFVGLKLWCTWQQTFPLELSLLVSVRIESYHWILRGSIDADFKGVFIIVKWWDFLRHITGTFMNLWSLHILEVEVVHSLGNISRGAVYNGFSPLFKAWAWNVWDWFHSDLFTSLVIFTLFAVNLGLWNVFTPRWCSPTSSLQHTAGLNWAKSDFLPSF